MGVAGRGLVFYCPGGSCQHLIPLLPSPGTTEEHLSGCLAQETSWTVILYSQHSSVLRCSDNRMTEKFQGSGRPAGPALVLWSEPHQPPL